MEGFVRDLAAFVGFDDAAMAAVRASAPAVLKHEAALTAAVYEHFLKFPASARFFLGPDGAPDVARIERRRHSLGRWLARVRGGRPHPRLRLLPPRRRHRPQPSRVRPRRQDPAPAHGRHHEHRPVGAGRRPAQEMSAEAALAGVGGVEQAAPHPPERIPGGLLPARPKPIGFGALDRTFNVERLRLTCGLRAAPRRWARLAALTGRSRARTSGTTRGRGDSIR